VARWQLAVEAGDLVAAAARERPLLVVLDDLHDADTSSVRLPLDVAAERRSAAAVVLATTRDDDRSWDGRFAARSALLRAARTVALQPFSAEDVAMLVGGVLDAGDSPDAARFAAAVARRTGGNPLFVTELDPAVRPVRRRCGQAPPGPEQRRTGR